MWPIYSFPNYIPNIINKPARKIEPVVKSNKTSNNQDTKLGKYIDIYA